MGKKSNVDYYRPETRLAILWFCFRLIWYRVLGWPRQKGSTGAARAGAGDRRAPGQVAEVRHTIEESESDV
jgi:hypothetical protein